MSCGRAVCGISAICSAIRSLQKCFMCKKSIILHFNKLVTLGDWCLSFPRSTNAGGA